MPDLLNVTTSDGKYTLIQREGGAMEALRNGEPWPAGVDGTPPHTYVGKQLLTFAQDLAAARERIAHLEAEVAAYAKAASPEYAAGVRRGIFTAVGMLNGQDVDEHFPVLREALQAQIRGERLTGPWRPPGSPPGDPPMLAGRDAR